MQKVYPYKTLAGALRALDNGGRFYHWFSKAGDDVVTPAELRKVAGAFGDDRKAALFFALATSWFTDGERLQVRERLHAESKALLRWHEPTPIEAARFATDARPGKPYIVTGDVTKFADETVTHWIWIPMTNGTVTTMIPVPAAQHFDVYAIGATPDCLVFAPRPAVTLRGRLRFAGIAKETTRSSPGGEIATLRLEPAFYCEIAPPPTARGRT